MIQSCRLCAILLFGSFLSATAAQQDDEYAEYLWGAWKRAYPTVDLHSHQQHRRRSIFDQTVQFLRQRGGSYVLDETAVMTREEFRALGREACPAATLEEPVVTDLLEERRTSLRSTQPKQQQTFDEDDFQCTVLSSSQIWQFLNQNNGQLPIPKQPTEIDYRGTQVTPVKNQGAFGTCWSFGFVETIEGLGVRQGHALVNVSNQQVIDCCPHCRGSAQDASFGFVLSHTKGRLATDQAYPYAGAPNNCTRVDCECKLAPAVVEGCVRVMDDDHRSGHAIRLALALAGPGAFGIDAACLRGYKRGIITNCTDVSPNGDPSPMINHEVLLVGAGVDEATGIPYFRAKNSWGTKFGEDGYFRFSQHGSKLGMGSVVFAADTTLSGMLDDWQHRKRQEQKQQQQQDAIIAMRRKRAFFNVSNTERF